MKIIAMIFLILFNSIASSHPINADLAMRNIKITSDFNGVDMLIFGALDVSGNIAIIIHGPPRSIIINKKEKKWGLWINGKREKLDNAEQFYAISSTKELSKITHSKTLQSMKVSKLTFSHDTELNNAFIEKKIKEKLYVESTNNIELINEKLFRSTIKFPNNIPPGRYIVEILLFYNNDLFGMQTIPLLVSKVGLESFIFDMHYLHPIIYALCTVISALFIGWISSILKRK